MKAMKFRVHNEAHSKAIQERLFELGYEWSENKHRIINTGKNSTINTYGDGKMSWSPGINSSCKREEATLDDLYKMQPEKRLRLNCDYEAVISDNIVKVGCQEFTFEKIRELCRMIDEK